MHTADRRFSYNEVELMSDGAYSDCVKAIECGDEEAVSKLIAEGNLSFHLMELVSLAASTQGANQCRRMLSNEISSIQCLSKELLKRA